MSTKRFLNTVLPAVLLWYGSIWALTADEIFTATGVSAGLCVHLGTAEGTLTTELDNGGRFVVHGLAVDNASLAATRSAIAAAKKAGIITAEVVSSWDPLPYPDNFVNLLVGDLDALGAEAPSRAELQRVLAPLGVSYLRSSGTWNTYVKPMPEGMAEWRHWTGDGDGNNLSQDRLVEPPVNLRWWAGRRHKVGKKTNNGFRLHDGVAVYEHYPDSKKPHVLFGRDAFSGVLLWRQPGKYVYFGNDASRPIVAGGGKIFTIEQMRSPLIAYDIRTGEKVKEYTEGLTMGRSASDYTKPRHTGWWRYNERMSVVYVNGMVIQTVDNMVRAIDAESGDVKWTYEEDVEQFVWQPVVSKADNTVYVGAGDCTFGVIRIGHAWAKSFLALDLTTGARKWRHTLPEYHLITQLAAVPGRLYLFNQPEYAKPDDDTMDLSAYEGYIACIRASDGEGLWEREFTNGYGTSAAARILVARDDKLHELTTWKLHSYDTATGTPLDTLTKMGFGGVGDHSRPGYGCDWNRSTLTYHLISGGFVDKDGHVNRHFISRSGCGTGMFPGYATVYVPDAGCACFSQMAGFTAMSSDPVPTPLPEADRLLTSGPAPTAYGELETPQGHLAGDWTDNDFYPDSAPALSGEAMSYTAQVHLHRVLAKDASGAGVWAYTTGGRITAVPILHEGTLFVASRDGWVYALEAATGKLKWRFMAAPNEQKMMTAGQLESRWPVMGLTLHDGLIYVSAGTHPDAGGGLYFYGLNPSDGKVSRRFTVRSPRGFTSALEANQTYAPKIQNGTLQSVDGQLQLLCDSHGPSVGTFLLKPDEWDGLWVNARDKLSTGAPTIVSSRRFGAQRLLARPMPDIFVRRGKVTVAFGSPTRRPSRVAVRSLNGRTIVDRAASGTGTLVLDLPNASGPVVVTVRTARQVTSAVVAIP